MSQIIAAPAVSNNPSDAENKSYDSFRFAPKPVGILAEPSRAFLDNARPLVANGYAGIPVSLFDKTPQTPGPLLTAGFVAGQVREGYGWPEQAWENGPYFFPLRGWPKITADDLAKGGRLHDDFEKWHRRASAEFAGVGVVHSSEFIAIDLDTRDPEVIATARALLDALPGLSVERVGSKGFARYYRVADGGVAKRQIKSTSHGDGLIIDILGDGSFSVIPPSHHIGAGRRYEWTGDSTLLDTPLDELQEITLDQIEAFIDLIIPLADRRADTRRSSGEYDDYEPGDSFDRDLNRAALQDLDRWVPEAMGDEAYPDSKGFRGRAFWRGVGNFNVGITPAGIVDHGDGRGYTPIGLVKVACGFAHDDYDGARQWLADRLGIETPYRRALRGIADMPACSVKIGSRWILDIPAGGVGEPVLRRVDESPGVVDAVENAAGDVESADIVESFVEGDNDAVLQVTDLVRESVMEIVAKAKGGKDKKREAAVATKQRAIDFNSRASDLRDRIKETIAKIEKAEIAVKHIESNLTGDDLADNHALAAARDALAEKKADLRELIKVRGIAIDNARDANRAFLAVKPEVRILSVYQGQGKSRSLIKSALPDLLAGGQKVLCMASSLDLVREQAADFREVVGDNFNSVIIYGMDAHYPSVDGQKGRPMCARHKEAKAIADAGLNASELCTSDGRVCEFAHACPIYQARLQAAEADVCFAASANAFVNSPGLKDFHPHAIFIDESFTGFGRADPVEVSIADLMAFSDPAAPADLEEGSDEEEQARHARRVRRHARRVELLSMARDLLADLVKHQASRGSDYHECKDDRGRRVSPLQIPIGALDDGNVGKLKRLEELFRILRWVGGFQLKTRVRGLVSPAMSREQIEAVIATGAGREAKLARARIALASEGIRSCRMVRTVNERVHVIDDNTLRIMPTSSINDRYLKPGPEMVEHIVVANGTPEARHLIEQAFTYQRRKHSVGPHIVEEIECPRAPAARTFSACQYKNHPLKSAKKMGRYGKQNATTKNLGAHNRRDSVAFIMQQIEQHAAGDPTKCVVVASEQTRKFLKDVLPEGVAFLERQKAIGVNAFSDFRLLVYIDADSPPHAVRERLMREVGEWIGPEHYEKGADGVWRLIKPEWQEHAERIKRSLAQQCLERLRTRWVKPGGIKQHAVIISEVDGILPDDEISVVDWHKEARDETRSLERSSQLKNELSRMLCHGIFTRNQRTMAGFWGRDFSVEELRELVTLLDLKWGELVYNNSIAPQPTLDSVEYRHAGAHRWSVAYGYGDVKALISNAFDGAVEFKDEAKETQIELVTDCELVTSELVTPVFTTPANLMAADPDRFSTISAAKMHLQRNPPARPDGWVEVVVTLEGRGQRAGAVYVPAGLGRIEVVNAVEAVTGRKLKAITAVG